jgi:hypothetical protein
MMIHAWNWYVQIAPSKLHQSAVMVSEHVTFVLYYTLLFKLSTAIVIGIPDQL